MRLCGIFRQRYTHKKTAENRPFYGILGSDVTFEVEQSVQITRASNMEVTLKSQFVSLHIRKYRCVNFLIHVSIYHYLYSSVFIHFVLSPVKAGWFITRQIDSTGRPLTEIINSVCRRSKQPSLSLLSVTRNSLLAHLGHSAP